MFPKLPLFEKVKIKDCRKKVAKMSQDKLFTEFPIDSPESIINKTKNTKEYKEIFNLLYSENQINDESPK